MLLLGAAAGVMYVLHLRDERRFARAMGQERPAEPVENALNRAWHYHRAVTSILLTTSTILHGAPGTTATGSKPQSRIHARARSEQGS
jgi:hypothetical protein